MSDIPYVDRLRSQLVDGITNQQAQTRRRRKVLVTSLVVLAAVGTLGPAWALLFGGPDEEGQRPPENYWEYPLGEAVSVSNPEQAGLVFVPDEPDQLPDPIRILVSEEHRGPAALREIAWVFNVPEYGRFVIFQRIAEESAVLDEMRELVSQMPGCQRSPAPGEFGPGAVTEDCTFGNRSAVTVQERYQGLLLKGSTTTSLWWAEPLRPTDPDAINRQFENPILLVKVIGPAEEIDEGDAAQIAELV